MSKNPMPTQIGEIEIDQRMPMRSARFPQIKENPAYVAPKSELAIARSATLTPNCVAIRATHIVYVLVAVDATICEEKPAMV